MSLEQLTAEGEALHEALGLEYYLTSAGRKNDPGFEAIYERFPSLVADEALQLARDQGEAELCEWLVELRLGRRVAALDEEQLRWEQRAVVEVGEERIPYLRVPIELANAANREYRVALDAARSALRASELNGIRRERFLRERDELRLIGFDDDVTARSTLSGIDVEALALEASEFLGRTNDMYRECLTRVVRSRLDVPMDRLERADTAWVFRARQHDGAFPSEQLLPLAQRQMSDMGLDAMRGGRVRFDTEEREGKQPRACCIPVRVPEEVYLLVRPHGGHADYRTFWHELGHAMHFAAPPPELSFSARWLGDYSVTEGYAMLCDHMTLTPSWLERYASLSRSEARELAFELGVHELYLARRYAAKLAYEITLYRSGFDDVGPRYAAHLSEATGFRFDERDYLVDVDPGFYAARYLRAWQLEAVLSEALTQRFDADWYCNPRAGQYVDELMALGQGLSADRLAEAVSGTGLGFAALENRLSAALE